MGAKIEKSIKKVDKNEANKEKNNEVKDDKKANKKLCNKCKQLKICGCDIND